MRPEAKSFVASQKSRVNNLIVLVELYLILTQITVSNYFFPRNTELYLANLQLLTRALAFSIFSSSQKSKNRNFRNLTPRLHLNFLTKLRKTYKNIAFRGRPTATVLQLNNGVFLSTNYRLIVAPRKFNVL